MMNRVIKFRLWNMTGQCMHSWRELVDKNKIHLLADQQSAYPVMQFTGLTDKNGVEIYEGDIVKINDGEIIDAIAQTVFHNGSGYMHGCGFYFKRLNKFEDCCLDDDGLVWYAEVIGNIYQNPELLK